MIEQMNYVILEGLMFGTRFVIPRLPLPDRGYGGDICFRILGQANTMEEATTIMNSLPVNTENTSENKS